MSLTEEQKHEYQHLIKEGVTHNLTKRFRCYNFEQELKDTSDNLVLQSIIRVACKHGVKYADMVGRTVQIEFVPDNSDCPHCEADVLAGSYPCIEYGWVQGIGYGNAPKSRLKTEETNDG